MLFSKMGISQEFIYNLGSKFFDTTTTAHTEARSINKNIKTGITLADISRHLSGIILIEDNIILSAQDSSMLKTSYIFNTSAIHDLHDSKLETYLKRRGANNLASLPAR